jgi:hypothetical protein
MPKRKMPLDPKLVAEAKSIVALAFRNGMKQAVDTVYKLLWLKQNDPEKYDPTIALGSRYTRLWDEPKTDVG